MAGLEKELGISAATARRDLAVLERQGKVKRTHGGAIPPVSRSMRTPSSSGWARLSSRRSGWPAPPRRSRGGRDRVYDSSTTAYYAARRILAGTSGVIFLTNLVPVMDLFSPRILGASMVGLGGIFRALTLSFVGPCTIHTIESYMADRAFISVKGITSKDISLTSTRSKPRSRGR